MPGNSITTGDINDSGVAIGDHAGVFMKKIYQMQVADDALSLQEVFVGALQEVGFDRHSIQQLDQSQPSEEIQLRIKRLQQYVDTNEAAGVPMTAETAYYMGLLAVYLGNRDEALNHFHRAAALDPSKSEAFRSISWMEQSQAMSDFKNGDYAAAEARLARAEEAAMGIMPQDASSLAHRGYVAKTRAQIARVTGNAKRASKRYAEAAEFFLESLQMNPNDAGAFNGLGNVYAGLQNYDGAIESCTQAIRLAPHYTHAYHDLALIYQLKMHEVQDTAEWQKLWEKARLAWEQTYDLAGLDADQAARIRMQQEVESQLKRLDIAMRRHKLLAE